MSETAELAPLERVSAGPAAGGAPATFASGAALDQAILDLLPAAVYVCSATGAIIRYNRKAAELWGRAPRLDDPDERFCGSHRLFWPDGRALAHADTPMAEALRSGTPARNVEVVIEQPSGRRVWAMVNIEAFRTEDGKVAGAINSFTDITARKEAERRLVERELLLEAVFDTTPECIKLVAHDGTVLRMNQAGIDVVQAQDAAEIEGQSAFDLIAPEHRDLWRRNHERVCAGERLTWEFDVVGLRGGRRHMETHAAPLTLADGSVAQLAVTRDATQHRIQEQMLRDSERRYREVLEALPSAVYTTDADGVITYYNRAAVELAGREPVVGVDRWCVTWRLYYPDGTPLAHEDCPMATALKERRPIRGVIALAERPDGTYVPFLPHPTPLFDADGNLAGAINMLVDVSDRRQAEEHELRLASIVEMSADAIVSKDLQGTILTWNDGAQALFGFTRDEAVGQPITIIIPPGQRDQEVMILERIRRGERLNQYETVRMRKDGTCVDVSLSVSPLKNADGRIIGASKIARDISERKQGEERRQLLIDELNHRVKNTLATVQSIASQTFRGEADAAAALFESRLVALSRAHDVLTGECWEGADMSELLGRSAAALYAGEDRRFVMHGPPLRLKPNVALSLSLAVHELCTNAAKYGALSNADGRVELTWRVRPEGRLHIRWAESDGPPVECPSRTGFGTRLIKGALARELDARVDLEFRPAGLVCEIDMPLARASASTR